MDKSDLQEHLLRLYLRLNGFFTSGFIVHSAESTKNKTEIDTIAVRFPHNDEPERQVKPDRWLDLSEEHIEFAICEAKAKARFNDALYADITAIKTLLRWAGMFTESQVDKLATEVQAILTPEARPSPKIRRTGPHHGVIVRSLLFCPEFREPRYNQSWFVGSKAAFQFMFSCLSPASEPATCGRRYGAGQWAEFAALVDFFKEWSSETPPSYHDFENAMNKLLN